VIGRGNNVLVKHRNSRTEEYSGYIFEELVKCISYNFFCLHVPDVCWLTFNYFLLKAFLFYYFVNLYIQTFTGNNDTDTVKRNFFRDTFVTRYLRICPKTYHRDMCLRVEVYGCSDKDGQ